MDDGEETYQEREAVAIFDTEGSLNSAVDALMQAGWSQSDLSLLGNSDRAARLELRVRSLNRGFHRGVESDSMVAGGARHGKADFIRPSGADCSWDRSGALAPGDGGAFCGCAFDGGAGATALS